MSVSTMRVLLEILSILKAIKFNFKGSYDKENLSHVAISCELYDTRRRVVSYERTTHVRSSVYEDTLHVVFFFLFFFFLNLY